MTGLPPVPLASEAAVRRLSLQVGRRLDGLLQGDSLGLLPGLGSEPDGSRVYQAGDDVRRLDWAVTARSAEPHVRTTVADRELETTLLVDLSASLSFGTARAEKRDVALALAAAFLHLTARPGDRGGAVVVGPDGVTRLPPRGGRAASVDTLRRLLGTQRAVGPGPGLADGLAVLARAPRRRGLTVVVTDLLDPVDQWARPLRLVAARHDVVVAQVVDRRELALPAAGVLRLVDPDTGRETELRTDRRTRERYAAAAAQRADAQRAAVRSAGAAHLVVRTQDDWLPQLATFLAVRRRTRAAGCPAPSPASA